MSGGPAGTGFPPTRCGEQPNACSRSVRGAHTNSITRAAETTIPGAGGDVGEEQRRFGGQAARTTGVRVKSVLAGTDRASYHDSQSARGENASLRKRSSTVGRMKLKLGGDGKMPFAEAPKTCVKRRAHFACCLCHGLGVDVHHILRESEGGSDAEDNAAPLCPSCHETYGANPQKRKLIRQTRDLWHELFAKRYAPALSRLDEIGNMLKGAATKQDLDAAVEQLVALIRQTANQPSKSTAEVSREVSQISGLPATGVGVNRRCQKCGTTIGLFIGDQGRCPECDSSWS